MSLLEKARELITRPTSRKELLYLLGGKVDIYRYEDITNFNNLDDLLGKYRSVILLYPNSGDENIGHWVAVFEQPGTSQIQYFDSYGVFPDDHIEDIEFDDLREPIPPILREWFLDEIEKGRDIFWNETQFQALATKKGAEIANCGLWCAARIKANNLSEDEFKRLYYDLPISQNISPDLFVCALIATDYPEFTATFQQDDPSQEKALVVVN
jgi:hypothetical protein